MNTTTEEAANIAGWYGKLPCLGDFASRRLEPEFITPWDAWLQRSIATSRQQLGERWLDIYLTSPMWRFILAPGVCGERAAVGILLPSVDKVGRYFPLTLAMPIEKHAADIVHLLALQDWFAGLERIGLAALNVEFSANDLEAALAAHRFPAMEAPYAPPGTRNMIECLRDPQPEAQSFHLSSAENLASAASSAARLFVMTAVTGKSCWWSIDQESGAAEFHYSAALPPDDYFTVMLGGSRVDAAGGGALPVDPLQAFDAAAAK
ncbi:MAG TPA: type VI secretion system-associated protein TagF [Burkholderiales bacterium]|nr:type VI secretion system-associated protein TagF [Burkholderiales bacterium]